MEPKRGGRRGTAVLVLCSAGLIGCGGGSPRAPGGPTAGERGGAGAGVETGAVEVVTQEEVDRARPVRAEEMLEARVPGVQLIRLPSGGISVRIRGTASLSGNNEPLYVVDGVPVNPSPGGGLDWLNPRDIARIEVLKDAIGTATYGMRGANGVVLITTRRGSR